MVSMPNLQRKVKGDSVDIAVRSTVPISELFVVVISKDVIVSISRKTFTKSKKYAFSYPVDKAKMAPFARIVVFTFSENGEIIPDSTQFEVDGVFTNKVSVAFDKLIAKPGNAIALNVQASPNSFVGILAVDKSVQILGDGNDITTDEVMEEVEKFDSKTGGPFCSWHCELCCSSVLYRKRRDIGNHIIWYGNKYIEGRDATQLFTTVGINIITDAHVHFDSYVNPNWGDGAQWPGGEGAKVSPGSSTSVKVRSVFPETWLWTDKTAGSDGTVRIPGSPRYPYYLGGYCICCS